MGNSSWSSSAYATYSTTVADMSAQQIFKSKGLHRLLDPKGAVREARDSEANPNSTPVIIGVDVTGSMGFIAEYLVRTGMGDLMNSILQRRPITDPAVCVMGIGDASCDAAPLQVAQFESDLVMLEWLEKIYIEGNGGGNNYESYDLPYFFALHRTMTDAYERRQEPGVIITIGDEMPPDFTRKYQVENIIGGDIPDRDIPFSETLRAVRPMYTPYHIIIAEGHFASRNLTRVESQWSDILGPSAITLMDHTKISPLITTMLEIDSGVPLSEAIKFWDDETRTVLNNTLEHVVASSSDGRIGRRIDM
jgi:hypothetical protein